MSTPTPPQQAEPGSLHQASYAVGQEWINESGVRFTIVENDGRWCGLRSKRGHLWRTQDEISRLWRHNDQAQRPCRDCATCVHKYIHGVVKTFSRDIPVRGCRVGQYMVVGQTSCPDWSPNAEVSGPPPVTPESKQSANGGFAEVTLLGDGRTRKQI